MPTARKPLKRSAPKYASRKPPPKVARHVPPTKPPAKVARHVPTSILQQSSYNSVLSRACVPNVKHDIHPNSRSGTSFHYVPYPLSLLPYPSWYALHHHHLKHISTDVQIVCPVCAKSRSAPPHHQKLFLVAERLLFEPQSTPLAMREKNEQLNWKVNYKLGILDPAVQEPGIVPGGLHSQHRFYYPFESEFEMRAALKLLEKAPLMSDGNWKIWLDMIDHLPIDGTLAGLPPPPESTKQVPRESQRHAVPPLPTPPSSQPAIPLTSSKNANSLKRPTTSLQTVEELDMSGEAEQPIKPAKPIKSSEPQVQSSSTSGSEFAKQRNTKIRTLQDVYQLLDLIERTSYCSARFLEAYAEFLRDDLCSECWFKHNILNGLSGMTSPPDVDQVSHAGSNKPGLPPSMSNIPPSRADCAPVGEFQKQSLPPSHWPEWKGRALTSTFRGR